MAKKAAASLPNDSDLRRAATRAIIATGRRRRKLEALPDSPDATPKPDAGQLALLEDRA